MKKVYVPPSKRSSGTESSRGSKVIGTSRRLEVHNENNENTENNENNENKHFGKSSLSLQDTKQFPSLNILNRETKDNTSNVQQNKDREMKDDTYLVTISKSLLDAKDQSVPKDQSSVLVSEDSSHLPLINTTSQEEKKTNEFHIMKTTNTYYNDLIYQKWLDSYEDHLDKIYDIYLSNDLVSTVLSKEKFNLWVFQHSEPRGPLVGL